MARVQVALVAAGFRRHATYRQATFAGAFTNTVFGFLRCYIMLSVADAAGGAMAGYSGPQLVSYVWLGQGLLAVVNSWTMLDLAERVRTGDVVADLLRPVDPLWTYLWTDIGRAGFALLTRFAVPLVVGAVAFDFYVPQSFATYPLFALSTVLAVVVCFACRYLIGLSAFWLLDIRGVTMFWVFVSGAASGLYFPLAVLPEWLSTILWVATPFPSLLQAPLDIAVERGGTEHALLVCLSQVVWVVLLLLACHWTQSRAVRKLVVQGG
ncbi:ABC-2 type transport system permease protein [Actinokineospora baliensis]|uniref:ABC transporter permease n=1 Tax=Actinokineospora baliensis TaxID=547056 RepID=UPI00195CDAC9|nr:ABC-2 family transporter protein [Actinokineospora baliensis]MBM7776321.1 ABC-2 type transport system permease protein [Actinokineospora baliensis]